MYYDGHFPKTFVEELRKYGIPASVGYANCIVIDYGSHGFCLKEGMGVDEDGNVYSAYGRCLGGWKNSVCKGVK